jgi:hypothetical protein
MSEVAAAMGKVVELEGGALFPGVMDFKSRMEGYQSSWLSASEHFARALRKADSLIAGMDDTQRLYHALSWAAERGFFGPAVSKKAAELWAKKWTMALGAIAVTVLQATPVAPLIDLFFVGKVGADAIEIPKKVVDGIAQIYRARTVVALQSAAAHFVDSLPGVAFDVGADYFALRSVKKGPLGKAPNGREPPRPNVKGTGGPVEPQVGSAPKSSNAVRASGRPSIDSPAVRAAETRLRASAKRAAEAGVEARAAWRAVRVSVVLEGFTSGGKFFGRLVYAVYTTLEKHRRQFESFLETRAANKLIDVVNLSAEERAILAGAFKEAIVAYEHIAQYGESLGMAKNEVHAFLNRWDKAEGMTREGLMQEMEAWMKVKKSGVPWGFKSLEHFEQFKRTAEAELTKLLKKKDSKAQAFLQGSSAGGIGYESKLPFYGKDLDVAILSRYLFQRAKREFGAIVETGPKRIGPLPDSLIDELGLNHLWDELTKVVGEGATGERRPRIELMLFDNMRAVTSPIGQSNEMTRIAIPLEE